jgi:hypothetical protein
VVRNLGLNLVATPFAPVNAMAERVVQQMHGWIGIDPADPDTTWGSEAFTARAVGLAFEENFASNPLHLVLLLATVTIVFISARRLPGAFTWYALALSAAIVVFSALLRWQPWNTRLELPLFVLGASLVATVVDRGAPRLSLPLAVLLLAGMLPWVVYNQARPLLGPRSILAVSRADQYFTNQPWSRQPYREAIGFLVGSQCGRVGLLPGEWWEYPLWALLREGLTDVRIESVGVRNVTAPLPRVGHSNDPPCALLREEVAGVSSAEPLEFGGRTYHPAWTRLPLTILTAD